MQRQPDFLLPVNEIGDYRVNTDTENDSVTNSEKVAKYLGKAGAQALYKGASEQNEFSTDARRKFVYHLETVLRNDLSFSGKKKSPKEDAITLQALLGQTSFGEDGVSLYKAAILEERNDKAFRDAVFLKAAQQYEGPKWKERLVLWVGGPSASGKSRSAKAVIAKIGLELMSKISKDNQDGNVVVAIDGGIEREVSQMRQLVLQVAIKKGFPGIKDLHKHTPLAMKGVIKKAAQAAKLSMVIPATFTNLKYVNPLALQETLLAAEKQPGVIQVFGEVVGPDGQNDQFKRTVQQLGDDRAWIQDYNSKDSKARAITMNNFDIGCESKNYNPEIFNRGQKKSKQAANIYMEHSQQKAYVKIVNDLVYVRQVKLGQWEKSMDSTDHSGDVIKISERDFNEWQALKNAKTPVAGLEHWLSQKKQANQEAPPLIRISLQGEFFNNLAFGNTLNAKLADLSMQVNDVFATVNKRSSIGSSMRDSSIERERSSSNASLGRGRTDSGMKALVGKAFAKVAAAARSSNNSTIEESAMEKVKDLSSKYSDLVSEIVKSEDPINIKIKMLTRIEDSIKDLQKVNMQLDANSDYLGGTAKGVARLIASLERNLKKEEVESAQSSQITPSGKSLHDERDSSSLEMEQPLEGEIFKFDESAVEVDDKYFMDDSDDYSDDDEIEITNTDSSRKQDTTSDNDNLSEVDILLDQITTSLSIKKFKIEFAQNWYDKFQKIDGDDNQKVAVLEKILQYAAKCLDDKGQLDPRAINLIAVMRADRVTSMHVAPRKDASTAQIFTAMGKRRVVPDPVPVALAEPAAPKPTPLPRKAHLDPSEVAPRQAAPPTPTATPRKYQQAEVPPPPPPRDDNIALSSRNSQPIAPPRPPREAPRPLPRKNIEAEVAPVPPPRDLPGDAPKAPPRKDSQAKAPQATPRPLPANKLVGTVFNKMPEDPKKEPPKPAPRSFKKNGD